MIGLGIMEILILLVLGFGCLGTVVAVVVLAAISAGRSGANKYGDVAPTNLSAVQGERRQETAPLSDSADDRQTIIARLTQRFCPQCRSLLATDAPEGLCPACLMAGAIGGQEPAAIEQNGLAVTTPPSGSQPPAGGEWADLAQRFPNLEILELLGRGGMGAVYKARQKNLDRLVALKVIPPEAAQDPAFAERFQREARALARMNHPNVVTVYDFGQQGGIYFLLMEYVDGINLRHTLQAGRLAPREALAIVPQVCDALQYAHDQGVVHRDIKPENVLLDRSGRVKIADFGLAKLLGKGPDDFTLTRTQQVMGTPKYMAPEQIEKPLSVDHRADIYSLGVVIYEMLTGELPLGRFQPPSQKVEVDVRIDQVVLRALEKEPDRRYQRASQVKTELASAASWPPLTRREEILGVNPRSQAPLGSASPEVPLPPTQAPSWHTPAPAVKHGSAEDRQLPGGVPLGMVLAVAFGMVLGVLMIGGGLALGMYAMTWGFRGFNGPFWGWMGGAFGCIAGGFGSLAGSYNTYRQMAGAEDLMRSPRTTWLDWVMRVYLAIGLVLLAWGIMLNEDVHQDGTPQVILGSIATFQAGLFLVWRVLMRRRARADEESSPSERVQIEPPLWRAVALPALAMAALFGVLVADVSFSSPPSTVDPSAYYEYQAYREWMQHLLLAGFVTVPVMALGLLGWRMFGPRQAGPEGQMIVATPLAHPAFLWAVVGLAGLSLFLPWFYLEQVSQPVVTLSAFDSREMRTQWTPTAPVLRQASAMPAGWRYAHRGIQQGPLVAAAALLVFAAVMTVFFFPPHHQGRAIWLFVASGVTLISIQWQLHKAADREPEIVVDKVTLVGLESLASRMLEFRPASTDAWRREASAAFVARPAIGCIPLLAACGLAILVGLTDLCWRTSGATIERPAKPAPPPVTPLPLDPAREAIRRRVAGPAIGLMIAGGISLLPEVLGLLILPAAILIPSTDRIQPRSEPVPSYEDNAPAVRAPAAVVPSVVLQQASGQVLVAGHVQLPLLLGQYDEAAQPRLETMMPIWAGLLLLFYLLNLAISITMIVAGWRMWKLKSYGLALVGSSLALLPCTFGWIIALPMGIWSLAVLLQPEVREAFES